MFVSTAANIGHGRWSTAVPPRPCTTCVCLCPLRSSPLPPGPCPGCRTGCMGGCHQLPETPSALGRCPLCRGLGERNSWLGPTLSRHGARAPCGGTSPGPCPAASRRLFLLPPPRPGNHLFAEEQLCPRILRDISSYQEKTNRLSPGGPAALQTPMLSSGPESAAACPARGTGLSRAPLGHQAPGQEHVDLGSPQWWAPAPRATGLPRSALLQGAQKR